MNAERIPKGMAIWILCVVSLSVLAAWAMCNGHDDAVEAGLVIFAGVLFLVGFCLLAWVVFEAVKSLLS